ncbi:puratrophin-1 isoform X2 [Periophthalmus magnuspinnatus]|uniref:puratrophin-1 isoform X2 n=1 Tax=Periophthalmus magnuspinnatus TaxID=409849 RepID=UPI002436B340|nr:puratrophin-1 isoform X2 [Periophthalmus magnuspinnatus]
MDSESLDRCLQTVLSALYPPFQVTSPTVLCQVLSVVERCYRGDGLRYLLHFLLPAKQFLQSLQQDACLPYCGLLFRHEGWPLCLHEKIVIQLCHLDQHLLRPGDFYLLVSPSSSSSSSSSASSSHHSSSRSGPPTPRLLLCTVSTTSRHVEEQEIPELALSSVFTMAWLDSVNRDREERGMSRMERLLLSAHGDVFRVPWEDLVYPQFVSRPRASLKDVKDASFCSSVEPDTTQEKTLLSTLGQGKTPLPCSVNKSTPSSDDSDSEGEYVELTELALPRFSPQKGPNAVHPKPGLSNGSIPKPPETASLSVLMSLPVPLHLSKSPQSRFNRVLLSSGVLCLPGSRDRSGRAVVTVNPKNPVWASPDCDSTELLQVLLYYLSTLSKEVQALGLIVLVDVRRAPPLPALYTALRSLQEGTPGSVHSVLLFINKDSPIRLDKPPYLQAEMLYSMKSLQKHVDLRQLPVEFGGSFNFSQSSWLCYRARVENLTSQCNNVISLLHKTINMLKTTPLPEDAQKAEQLLSKYKAVMCSILQDSRLVQLQQEGGASLSRLRRDESSICATEDYRAAVESVSSLYDQVDELLHCLVTLSNSKTQEINFILEFTELESGFTEVRRWLEEEGEARLKTLDEPEDSLELLLQHQRDFKDFCPTALDWCKQGQALLKRLEHWDNISSVELKAYEVKVHTFWAQLQDFSQRATATGQNIDRAVRLYSFLDQAYGWALAGMRHLAGITMEDCSLPEKCPVVIRCLEEYNRLHPPIPDSCFQEMRALAGELRGERGLRQWSFAWSKCQETKKMFDRKMEAALRTRDSNSNQRRRSDSEQSKSSSGFSRKSLSGFWGVKDSSQMSPYANDETNSTCSSCTPSPTTNLNSPITSTPQHTPLLQRLFRSPSNFDDTKDSFETTPSPAPSLQRLDSTDSFNLSFRSPSICSSSSFTPLGRRQQLRKTQSFDCPPTPESSRYGASPRTLSEPARRGNTGVFIKGLEVSSTEAADRTLCPRTGAQSWVGHAASRSPSTQSINSVSSTAEQRPRGSKLRHIVEEMVTTEREYVRSLRYIIHHYFPEMERPDVPQDLRGKRSVVFGNLEKLLDFHSQFFLKELEACWRHPLRVPHCFLRHQEQFGLYALYSKNKPKSDTLLSHHGNSFFRRKQVELGDKMDLSSYLLKPIQRMSKYALLLSDLIKEVAVSQSQEAELATLHAATNMVKFQLRHGNDLLAMDAIRDCDVNLKEQGQLIRQDEFTVWSGRRKCQRHVFLFEDLILFSKPKRMEGGLDVFIYKHSFKTADVGLTESTGDDGLKFEIWFRRRTSKNQTFLLQAPSSEVKQSWTSDIARLLWNQATRNKEMRLKEMVSMGVGSKPFLDIQPSDAAISDRAVHYIMKSRGARTRASIAVSVFDHSNPFKRSVTSDPSAPVGPSSCSLLGPLNLHMFSQTLPPVGASEGSFINSCIEEDEQEHETSSQPSMTTESSGSSSRCLSGSTGSDSGCVSSHLQEALQEEQNPSQASSSSSSSSSNPPPTNKEHLSSPYISTDAGPVISPATIV